MKVSNKQLQLYIVFAILSLFASMWLPHMDEEAVYTLSAFEMWFKHEYGVTRLFGHFYGRPPMMSWLMWPILKVLGWDYVLIASRFVSAIATTGVVLLTVWFVNRLTRDYWFALLVGVIYLTGDLLFVRGWLAYADPLLSFFVAASIIFLWLGVEEKRNDFLLIATASLFAGFLTKAISVYWIYGLAGIVLLVLHKNRGFLLRPTSIVLHLFVLFAPFLWSHMTDARYLKVMWNEATSKEFAPSIGKYFYQIFVTQPAMLLLRLAPFSLIAIYYYFRDVRHQENTRYESIAQIALWIALLNFEVCWFAARWPEARYYMPVLPFFALIMAYVIANAAPKAHAWMGKLLLVVLLFKFSFIGFYYYKYEHLMPNYRNIAQSILKQVGDAPLGVDEVTMELAPVELVGIELNLQRYPKPPLELARNIERKMNSGYNHASSCPGVYVVGQRVGPYDKQIAQYAGGKRRVLLVCRYWHKPAKWYEVSAL